MSEFKGTKGEWRSDETINGNYSIVALRDRYVVELGHIDSKQDANLIAAAPELLEALQWMKMALNSGTAMDIAIGQEKSDAAIAKALGQ